MSSKSFLPFVFLFSLLLSCKTPNLFCTKNQGVQNEVLAGKVCCYKYYLPRKVLRFTSQVTVAGKYEEENGVIRFVDKAKITVGEKVDLEEIIERGDPYFIVTKNKSKSLNPVTLGLTCYNSGILKGVNAENVNSGIEIAEGAFNMLAGTARSVLCSFPTKFRGEAWDTTFTVAIEKTIDFEPGKYSDTIYLDEFIPGAENNVYFSVALLESPHENGRIDTVTNGFVYRDPKWIRTQVIFHNLLKKQNNTKPDLFLLEKDICYPQLGCLQALLIPHSIIASSIAATFSEEGVLTSVNYVRNKNASSRIQGVNTMAEQLPILLKDLHNRTITIPNENSDSKSSSGSGSAPNSGH